MVCSCPTIDDGGGDDAGFATPAAAVVSLGLALVASALTVLAVSDLKAAQAEAARTRAEYQLAGLQTRAGLQTLTQPAASRRVWSLPAPRGSAEVLAEPEAAKAALANPDDALLTALKVRDVGALKQRLQALNPEQGLGEGLENADSSPLWRACARSLISVYGEPKRPKTALANPSTSLGAAATLAPAPIVWRTGEVWRIRVTAAGWADDRIVRLTGDQRDPAAVIARRFYRREPGRDGCAALTG